MDGVLEQIQRVAAELAEAVCADYPYYVVLAIVVLYFVMTISSVTEIIACVFQYLLTFFAFLRGTSIHSAPFFNGNSPFEKHARAHVYSLALIFYLWDKPHYRNGTFQFDMVKNLRDVAVPGTGISLKWFSYFKITALLYLVFVYPTVVLVAAVNAWAKRLHYPTVREPYQSLAQAFREQLLAPQDWFAFWRLNCRVATWHSYVFNECRSKPEAPPEGDNKNGYEMECKWTFLRRCKRLDVPHTPWLTCDAVVCKNRNEEGGLGYMSFKNATAGGDWIIQQRLVNGEELGKLIPSDAPLSTFRVITGSWGGLEGINSGNVKFDPEHPAFVFSTVFRAGLSGAATDHKSILFNVDPQTGVVKRGTTNAHWYRLGLHNIFTCPWTSEHNFSRHPDKADTEEPVEGQKVERIEEIKQLCVRAHEKLCPKVPLSGWDVALTKDHGMVLLEANLSCNFFRGDFDKNLYFDFVNAYLAGLESAAHK